MYVPAEAISRYQTTAPWSSFGTIKAIGAVEVPKCAAPQISYNNGKITIASETEGAEFITTVTNSYAKNYYTEEFDIEATYNISVYATASGYENSETVNATLCWIDNGESDDSNGVIGIPATAVLITSAGGILTISYPLDDKVVTVYTTDGVLIGTASIENGSATISTGLTKGTIAIVRIGEKSVKIVVG